MARATCRLRMEGTGIAEIRTEDGEKVGNVADLSGGWTLFRSDEHKQ